MQHRSTTPRSPHRGRGVRLAGALTLALALAGCAGGGGVAPSPSPSRSTDTSPSASPSATPPGGSPSPSASAPATQAAGPGRTYPWHTDIVSTTFWVGEIFDPNASDGSQVLSTYDGKWERHYGGCDGVSSHGKCETERRTAANGYRPSDMTPKENPFYLDLPYDDINDRTGFADRDRVVPWADDEPYASHHGDQSFSYMKNRWVEIRKGSQVCYGQIQDAGPGQYHDAAYVFGSDDARPANKRYNGAGMDVSPALNGCLGFAELNGEDDHVDWRFVEAADVPSGPWSTLTTRSGLTE